MKQIIKRTVTPLSFALRASPGIADRRADCPQYFEVESVINKREIIN